MRKCGFYWVKVIREDSNEVAYWNGVYWELTGTDSHYESEELEINENQIKRELNEQNT